MEEVNYTIIDITLKTLLFILKGFGMKVKNSGFPTRFFYWGSEACAGLIESVADSFNDVFQCR